MTNFSHQWLRWGVATVALLCLLGFGSPAAALGRLQDTPTPPAEATPPSDATPVAEQGVPVVVNGRELFRLQTRVGSLTPTERAAAVAEHIGRLANNPFVGAVTLTVVDLDNSTDVVASSEGGGDQVVVTVSEADAAAVGRDRRELAQEWASIIQTAVAEGHSSVNAQSLTIGLGVSLLILLLLVLIIWAIDRLGDWLTDKLDPTTESGRVPRTLARSEFYQSGQFSRSVRSLMLAGKLIMGILLVVVAIPLILRAFAQTRDLGNRLIGALLEPLARLWDGFVGFLPDLIFLLVLAGITWLLIRVVHLFFREVGRGVIRLPSFEPDWAPFTAKVIAALLVTAAVIIGFTSLPFSQLPVFQGVSAFIALLLTLASTSAISNIVAGVILTYTSAFRLGDVIQIQAMTGEVIGKYLLTTRVRTFKNEIVTFPNSLVLSNTVTNYSRIARGKGLLLHTTVTIGYSVPWQRVHELLIAAALRTEHILSTPSPFVLQTALNDYHVSYELNALTRRPDLLLDLYSDLHRHIQEQFNAAGVEIMSPAYAALRDGNAITLPPEFLSEGHRSHGLRVETDDH